MFPHVGQTLHNQLDHSLFRFDEDWRKPILSVSHWLKRGVALMAARIKSMCGAFFLLLLIDLHKPEIPLNCFVELPMALEKIKILG